MSMREVEARERALSRHDVDPARPARHDRAATDGWRDEEVATSAVLDATAVGQFRFHVESSTFTCSPACRAHLGLDGDAKHASYEALFARIAPEDRGALERALRSTAPGASFAFDSRVVAPSGASRRVLWRGWATTTRTGTVVAGVVLDLTGWQEHDAETDRLGAELAWMQAVVEHMPVAIMVADASGRIVLVNAAAREVLPAIPQSMLHDDLTKEHPALHPDGRPLMLEECPLVRALRGASVPPMDLRFLSLDGSERWVRIASAPIPDGQGVVTGAVAAGFDVDREKRAEAAQRASEERLQMLFRSPLIGIFSSRLDGRIIDANDTFLRMVGYTRDDLLAGSVNWRDMTPPELRTLAELKVAEVIDHGSQSFEKEYVRKDGSRIPVLLGTVLVERTTDEIVTFALDLTEPKRAAHERETLLASLERSEKRYRLAALATNDCIWDADLRTNRIHLRTTFGCPDEWMATEEEWAARVHPQDRARVLASKRAAIESGARDWQDEYRVQRSDGSWMLVVDRGYIVPDADGQPAWMVGASRDITEERCRQEFERQLIGIVSHDLKNPLHTILLAAELVQRTPGLPAATARNVERIRTATKRAGRMVRDLLDFTRARLGSGIPIERREADLGRLLDGLVEEARAAHPEHPIALRTSGPLTGSFDPDRLTQVVTNLVDNAMKYSARGSMIRVDAHGTGDSVVLEVHNDGPPISPDVLPRIFEPLQRGDGAEDDGSRSVGLGLYIVKHLVDGHGGRIGVRSEEGSGTTFRVELPRGLRAAAPLDASRA